jgi:hypothetical protein
LRTRLYIVFSFDSCRDWSAPQIAADHFYLPHPVDPKACGPGAPAEDVIIDAPGEVAPMEAAIGAGPIAAPARDGAAPALIAPREAARASKSESEKPELEAAALVGAGTAPATLETSADG